MPAPGCSRLKKAAGAFKVSCLGFLFFVFFFLSHSYLFICSQHLEGHLEERGAVGSNRVCTSGNIQRC